MDHADDRIRAVFQFSESCEKWFQVFVPGAGLQDGFGNRVGLRRSRSGAGAGPREAGPSAVAVGGKWAGSEMLEFFRQQPRGRDKNAVRVR